MKMRKLYSILLAAVLALTMGVPSFAIDEELLPDPENKMAVGNNAGGEGQEVSLTDKNIEDGTDPSGDGAVNGDPQDGTDPSGDGTVSGNPQDGTDPSGDGTVNDDPQGETDPSGDGTVNDDPQGETDPPEDGTANDNPQDETDPPEDGTANDNPQDETDPPEDGAANDNSQDETDPPEDGAANDNSQDETDPPEDGAVSGDPQDETEPPTKAPMMFAARRRRPTIDVVVPSSGEITINPYHLKMGENGLERTEEQIVGETFFLQNLSEFPVRVSASSVGRLGRRSEIVLVDTPPERDAEEKEVFLYAEFLPTSDDVSEPSWSRQFTDASNQLMVLFDTLEKEGILELAALDQPGSYGAMHMFGSTVVNPANAWGYRDQVDARFAFTFEAITE